MDVYCPRCEESVTQVDDTTLQRGKCPTCGGQVNLGQNALQVSSSLDGAIAMSFVVGSRVAVPLDANFEQSEIDLSSHGEHQAVERKMPPPPPPDDADDVPMSYNTEESGADGLPPPPMDDNSASDESSPDITASPFGDPPASIHEQETRVGPAPGRDDSPDFDNQDTVIAPLPEPGAAAEDPESIHEQETVVGASPVVEQDAVGGDDPVADGDDPVGDGDDPVADGDDPVADGDDPVADGNETAAPPEPAAEPARAGAHLQLPSIDFSMPDLGVPDFGSPNLGGASASAAAALDDDATTVDTSPAGAATAPQAELPAHLQLPSFPDFQMPPIPGEDPNITDEIAIEGVAGGSFAAENTAPGVSNRSAPGGDTSGEHWAVAGAQGQGVPPPLPAPPPLPPGKKSTAPQHAQAQTLPGGVPAGLPDLGLPAFAKPAQQKHELTLVGSDAALKVAAKGSKTGMVVIILSLLVVAGAGGAVWHFGIDKLAEMVFGPQEVVITKTDEEKAEDFLFQGKKAYIQGKAAQDAKKEKEANKHYEVAIQNFRKALKTYPRMGKVHRNLAIVLAQTDKQEAAVKHYKFYLAKVPDAEDRKEVQEIVDDYEKMQKQKKKRK